MYNQAPHSNPNHPKQPPDSNPNTTPTLDSAYHGSSVGKPCKLLSFHYFTGPVQVSSLVSPIVHHIHYCEWQAKVISLFLPLSLFN